MKVIRTHSDRFGEGLSSTSNGSGVGTADHTGTATKELFHAANLVAIKSKRDLLLLTKKVREYIARNPSDEAQKYLDGIEAKMDQVISADIEKFIFGLPHIKKFTSSIINSMEVNSLEDLTQSLRWLDTNLDIEINSYPKGAYIPETDIFLRLFDGDGCTQVTEAELSFMAKAIGFIRKNNPEDLKLVRYINLQSLSDVGLGVSALGSSDPERLEIALDWPWTHAVSTSNRFYSLCSTIVHEEDHIDFERQYPNMEDLIDKDYRFKKASRINGYGILFPYRDLMEVRGHIRQIEFLFSLPDHSNLNKRGILKKFNLITEALRKFHTQECQSKLTDKGRGLVAELSERYAKLKQDFQEIF